MFVEFNYGCLYYGVIGKIYLLRLIYGLFYFVVIYNIIMIDV